MEVNRSPNAEGKPFNEKLYKAIKHTLRISLVLSGCYLAVQTGLADTSNLPTVDVPPPPIETIEVPPPPPYDPPPYEPPVDPFPDDGVSGDDGGGGGDGGETREEVCARISLTKPAMCPNPIPMPSGASYAEDKLPGASFFKKSPMLMAIAYSQGRAHGPNGPATPDPTAAWVMNLALEKQTQNYAKPGMPSNQANALFREDLKKVCELEALRGNSNSRPAGALTVPEEFCFDILKAFDQETNDQMNFIQYFADWSKRFGVPLASYVPGPVMSDLDQKNSIMEKWRIVSSDAACSTWWQTYEQNQCTAP